MGSTLPFIIINREVIPGATSPLSNFIALNALNCAMEMNVQKLPGNQQQYFPHLRRYLPVSSHHVIFNHLDLVMQTVFLELYRTKKFKKNRKNDN